MPFIIILFIIIFKIGSSKDTHIFYKFSLTYDSLY